MSETPNPIDVHVGLRLRARRKYLGVSQEKLASALKLTFQQVQKYERGVNRVSASRLYEAAAALSVDVGYFFEGLDRSAPADPVADPMLAFSACHGGQEIAATYAGMDAPQRASVLSVVRAIAGVTAVREAAAAA